MQTGFLVECMQTTIKIYSIKLEEKFEPRETRDERERERWHLERNLGADKFERAEPNELDLIFCVVCKKVVAIEDGTALFIHGWLAGWLGWLTIKLLKS